MKRLLVFSLTIIMLAMMFLPTQGFAAQNAELEKAISTAKSVLNIASGYDNFTYSMQKQNEKTIFNLTWSDSKNKLGNISLAIDGAGRIINYYCYKPFDNNSNHSKFPKITKIDALKSAEEFIKKVNPSIWDKIVYQENILPMNINDTNYNFNYVMMENGVVFPQNNVSISINSGTGEVQNYNCNWIDNLVFPSTVGVLSKEDAQKTYIDKLGLKLLYKMSYSPDSQKPYLAYTNVYQNGSIDAETGDVVYSSPYFYAGGGGKADAAKGSADMSSNKVNSQVLTPEEKKAVENAEKLIDEAKAENIARTTLSIDSSYNLESINLYNYGRNQTDYIWSMQFNKQEKPDSPNISYISVSIDALTGDITNFYRNTPYAEGTKVKYNKEDSIKLANDFIKSLQKDKSVQVEYTNWGEQVIEPLDNLNPPRQYQVTFTRKTNNIYFLDNGFNLSIDAASGDVINYNYTWYKGEFPIQGSIISSDQAHKVLFDTIGFQLQYIAKPKTLPSPMSMKIMPPRNMELNPDIRLVYAIKSGNPINIDATSGKLLDYSGEPYDEKVIAIYSDIQGDPAENQIKSLALYGISLPGSEFKPKELITQKEFLYLLQKSTNYYGVFYLNSGTKSDASFYSYLTNSGIIKEGERSQYSHVSKQEAVKYLIRALNYEKIAMIKGIYSLPLKDVSSINPDLYGYIALAYGLNIIKDTDGYIMPSDSISRSQAAILIYNFLNVN